MVPETLQGHEEIVSPRFDAIHIHGYWMSQMGDDSLVKLGLRSRLATRAAATIYDEGRGADKIVLTLGQMWGEEYPSVAQLMKEELVEKYRVPAGDVIARGEAYSTNGEVDTFLSLAQQHGWTNVLDVAAQKHLWTIPSIYKKRGVESQFQSVEETLRGESAHLDHLLDRLAQSKYEYAFTLYEGVVWTAMHLPGGYERMDKMNQAQRDKKGHDLPGMLGKHLQIDVYKL